MKLIIAYVQPESFPEVKKELEKEEINRMSVSRVRGSGQQKGYMESYRGVKEEINLLPKIRIEMAVNDSFLKKTVDTIVKAARTGEIGDGKIFVLPIEECIRIRTGEKGVCAIGGDSEEAKKASS